MTAATFAHLPLQVGGVALAQAGRAALWVISRYMRNPLTNSAIAALVVTTAMAGSNALYGQRHEHPSPLFAPLEAPQLRDVAPVVPAIRPPGLGAKPAAIEAPAATEAAIDPVETDAVPLGNADVIEVQRKLEQLQFFSGKIDGVYGRQTAAAIKKFEEAQGLKPTGEFSREIVERIKAATPGIRVVAPVAPTQPAPVAVEEPVAVTLPKVESPKAETTLPSVQPDGAIAPAVDPKTLALAQPKPLAEELTTGSIAARAPAETPTVLGRPLPESPEEALEMAADTAGEAIETIISGVQTVAMNRPGNAYAAESQPLQVAALTEASADQPRVGVPLDIEDEPLKPGTPIAVLDTKATPDEIAPVSANNPVTVAKVQRGLASLGFLHGPADGVAGEATAKAIRNFEVYFNYKVTGRISPELLDLLVENGAVI